MRSYRLNVTSGLALVLAAILALSCKSHSVLEGNWPNSETLSFGITDTIDDVHIVLNLGMDGSLELTCASGDNKVAIDDRLSKEQADTLKALVMKHNVVYMESVHKYEREDLQNNPKLYTNHRGECLDAIDVTLEHSDLSSKDFCLVGALRPVIMYMHIGNRMCYIYGDVRRYYDREGRYGEYNELNRFVFNLLCDKLRENGISNKYTEMKSDGLTY